MWRTWSRGGGKVRSGGPCSAGLWDVLQGFRSTGRLRSGFQGDAAIPPVLCASVCLFLRAATRGDRGNSKSAGARHEAAGIANATLGKRRLLPRATSWSRINTGGSTTYVMPIVIGDRE